MPDNHRSGASDLPPGSWDGFVERFGIAAAVGFIAAMACTGVTLDMDMPPMVTMCQFMLAMIIVGCVGVMSYRNTPTSRRAAV